MKRREFLKLAGASVTSALLPLPGAKEAKPPCMGGFVSDWKMEDQCELGSLILDKSGEYLMFNGDSDYVEVPNGFTDVRVFNRVLDGESIRAIYVGGKLREVSLVRP